MEQAEKEVANSDISEEKQSKGAAEKDFWRLFHREGAAEAEALRLRELRGLEREVKAVSTLSALPVFEPKVAYTGVKWEQSEQQWRAQCNVGGVNRKFQGEAQGSL